MCMIESQEAYHFQPRLVRLLRLQLVKWFRRYLPCRNSMDGIRICLLGLGDTLAIRDGILSLRRGVEVILREWLTRSHRCLP